MRVLVLGVTGMLGSAVFRVFSEKPEFSVWGTLRNSSAQRFFPSNKHSHLITNVDVLDQDSLVAIFQRVKPNVVINCVGLIKQLENAKDPLTVLPINAMLPHRLSKLCALIGARLIHVSTDCVFSGSKGGYHEFDLSDAEDLYGKSKFIGELHEDTHAITLRTSIIGHELNSTNALLGWFLSQNGTVNGYSKAVFSGLPTVELARVMRDYVIPNSKLHGLYHVSAKPIAKLNLLRLISIQYGKDIEIRPNDSLVIDRSLNSERFTNVTGYVAPEWPDLIKLMHQYL